MLLDDAGLLPLETLGYKRAQTFSLETLLSSSQKRTASEVIPPQHL